MLGAGLVINRDKAGDSEYGTTQANISLSYIRPLNKSANQYISFAVQSGIAQRTINYSRLTFDNQYDGLAYNSNMSSGETFGIDNFSFLDFSAGGCWNYKYSNNENYTAGIAVFHLNRPRQSLMNDSDIRLDRKLVINGSGDLELSDKFSLLPGLLIMKQGKYSEVCVGGTLKMIKDKNILTYTAFKAGTYFRAKDAAILTVGMDYKTLSIGISYDINYSKLKPASHLRGGLELSLIYVLDKLNPKTVRVGACPIF